MPLIKSFICLILIFILSMCSYLDKARYAIIYETTGLREDGGKSYFVLVEPIVNLMDNNYKINVKRATKKIVLQKGEAISISFFDDRKLLDKYYQNKLETTSYHETKEELPHHIADYNGKLRYGSFLIFFPGISPANYIYAVEQEYALLKWDALAYTEKDLDTDN